MPDTQEILKNGGNGERRNPVDPNPYHQDPRDRPQDHEHGESWFLPHISEFEVRKRDAVGHLEKRVRTLAEKSAEKPRWQKIIEHANSLADEMEMSREQFYSTALIQFIEKLENARITNELNEVYKNIDQEEDVAFLNHLVRYYDPRLADE